jgi:aryl-alcohol dehydrogenase-like predicted oxidoreductase
MEYATKEGTFKYLKQFPKYSKDFYRFNGELFFSSLGLGTYRKEPYREENYIVNYKEAVKTAILNGINLIDTAINYRYQVSEQEIGEALMELFDEGKVQRESLIITSKAGFLPLEFPFPENPYEWIKSHVIEKDLSTPEEIVIDQHCMSPAYLRWSVEQSLKNLHLNTLDILFLHNPETQLGYVEREVVLSRIKEAFTLFEQLVDEGKIRYYGIASWNAFLYDEDHTEYLSLNDIMQIAQEVGGESHHFKYIQSPFNLVKTHAYNYANQQGPDGRYYTLMQAIEGFGLNLLASSSLLQMNLFKGKFDQTIRETLGTSELTDISAALQFARSGNVLSALFGAADTQHVKENMLLAYVPSAKHESIKGLFGAQQHAV